MLWVSTDIKSFQLFKEKFQKGHEGIPFLDLSTIPVAQLADESESIVSHHSECAIFLGHIEPGWMLDAQDQTRIRKLFRKFDVGLVTRFSESLPFSWKNEIDFVFVGDSKDG